MKGFLRAGHTPTLVAALLYFDVSFMAWVLLGPLAPFLRSRTGSDRDAAGPRHGYSASGRFALPAVARHARRAHRRQAHGSARADPHARSRWPRAGSSLTRRLTSTSLGFFLGIAGASFAVALPLASRWYPPEYQGLAMGIAGAGNSGTLLATLFAPQTRGALRLAGHVRHRDGADGSGARHLCAHRSRESPSSHARNTEGLRWSSA